MDAVEIVLRTEELFSISITDDEASLAATVGDLYRLVCTKLQLEPLAAPLMGTTLPVISEKRKVRFFGYRLESLPPPATVLPFTAQSVWDCLVTIFVDHMRLDPEEVRYHARIVADLGID